MSDQDAASNDDPKPRRVIKLGGRRRSPETIERFGLPPSQRLAVFTGVSFACGATLGTLQGGNSAALRFRAENSHRLPTTTRGWTFYYRAKHAYVFKHAVFEANRMGLRLVPWTALLIGVEDLVDTLRLDEEFNDTRKDFMSTTVAGGTVAGGFSLWNRVPMPTAARMVKMGLSAGLFFGFLQDSTRLLQGHKLAYVDLVRRYLGFSTSEDPDTDAKV